MNTEISKPSKIHKKENEVKVTMNFSRTGPDKEHLSILECKNDGQDILILRQGDSEIKLITGDAMHVSDFISSWYYRIKNICLYKDCDDQRIGKSVFCSPHDKIARDRWFGP